MKKKWLIILMSVISLALIITAIIIINPNTEETSFSAESNLTFANNYISYVLDDNETMSFNLFGAQDVSNGDSSILQSVDYLETNNPNIEIVDYSIDAGLIHEDHQLINIIVDVKLLNDDLEQASELIIHYDNDKEQSYEIGDIILQNNDSFTDKDISPKGDFTVGYPTATLDVNLINNTDETILMNKINDLNDTLSFTYDEQEQFSPNESKHIDISFEDKGELESIDFYTITPILQYSINEEDYFYNMPGVIYGILIPDEEKIERALD